MNVIITGASRGIGLGLVKKYLNKANKIYAVAKNKERLDEVAKLSKKIEPIVLDMRDFESVREFSKSVECDLLILNAGISTPHSANFPPFEAFKEVIDVNFLSLHAMIEGILPKMQAKKSGKIVFISSLASIIASPTSLAYSASKRAVNSYAQSLRNMVAKDNIKVINILPGFIKTDMTAKNDFYMPFLMELDKGVDRIYSAIEKNKKFYPFPKRFYYILRIFENLPLSIQDKLLQSFVK